MIERSKRSQFVDVFVAKNKELNLSAIRDADGVFLKHVSDALEVCKVKSVKFIKWVEVIDVGTWGWIPLLPLAIEYPDVHFTGLDSVKKKTVAIADMATTLGLKNVAVVRSRAEDHKKQYDILTARAVAFSDALFNRTYHLVKKWGLFVLYKMFSEEEEAWLDSYCEQRKMNCLSKHYYKLFEEDIQRVIYILQKP